MSRCRQIGKATVSDLTSSSVLSCLRNKGQDHVRLGDEFPDSIDRLRLIAAGGLGIGSSPFPFFSSVESMKTASITSTETTVARRVAGEDIAAGDFVTVMNDLVELPSFLWACSAISLPAEEPVRIRYMVSNAGIPHEVISVCLPFVYAKTPGGTVITIDTRQRQLVRLDETCARLVWKELKLPSKKKRK